jgi:hypothetical protein
MQNLKQMEDYKKDRLSKANPEEGDESELDMDLMELPDTEVEGDEEFDSPEGDTFSAEIPAAPVEVEGNGSRPYMVITNLKKIADHANQLIGMVQSSGKVEEWAVDHITTSADDIEEVFNYYKYKD